MYRVHAPYSLSFFALLLKVSILLLITITTHLEGRIWSCSGTLVSDGYVPRPPPMEGGARCYLRKTQSGEVKHAPSCDVVV
jgi:hypothetical protein